jgi:hypothetical protein
MKKNTRQLSLALCATLLLNTTGAGAMAGLASLVKTVTNIVPTLIKTVEAVAAIGQIATTIAIVAGGANIDTGTAQTVLGVFGALSQFAGGKNATGDVFARTKQEMSALEANKQNQSHIIPADAPINAEGKNWGKIQLPPMDRSTMIQFPTITSGNRAGQENKIVVQLTKVSRQEKNAMRSVKPVVETEKGTPAETKVATNLNYKVTFYAVMPTDQGQGYELGSMILSSLPKNGTLYCFVQPNGELNILSKVQNMNAFTVMPAQFSAQEWQNGTALRTAKREIEEIQAKL